MSACQHPPREPGATTYWVCANCTEGWKGWAQIYHDQADQLEKALKDERALADRLAAALNWGGKDRPDHTETLAALKAWHEARGGTGE